MLTLALTGIGYASDRSLKLERDFANPPAAARPWVYWFWLNGNISSNGITADLEAMQRVGVGGVLIMEVDQGAPLGPAAFQRVWLLRSMRHRRGRSASTGKTQPSLHVLVLPTSSPSASSAPLQGHAQQIQHQLACLQLLPLPGGQ